MGHLYTLAFSDLVAPKTMESRSVLVMARRRPVPSLQIENDFEVVAFASVTQRCAGELEFLVEWKAHALVDFYMQFAHVSTLWTTTASVETWEKSRPRFAKDPQSSSRRLHPRLHSRSPLRFRGAPSLPTERL